MGVGRRKAPKPRPGGQRLANTPLAVVYRPLGELVPYAANARTHSPAQVAQIAKSMQEFGWTNPILVDGARGIIAGHGRVLAAQQLGLEKVPCIELAHLTPEQRRAYVLADNKLALNADWDPTLLRDELIGLQASNFDLGLIGFSPAELGSLMAWSPAGGLTDPDAAPPLPAAAASVLGDAWLLGRHRLVCGDSTDGDAVGRALNGVVPRLMVTDPPYGVNYDPTWRAGVKGRKTVRQSGAVLNDDRADWREAWALFPGDVAYVWHGALFAGTVQESLAAAGLEVRTQIIWTKDRFVLSRGNYHWRHETAWYAVRKGATAGWRGGRKQDTVWRIEGLGKGLAARVLEVLEENGVESTVWEIPMTVDDGATGHGTQKPVECMRRPIENNSEPGHAVYEPFSGSGTTIIAAEMTGRSCHAIELSPGYVDVAVARWQAFTGKQAMLEGDGRTFDAIKVARSSKGHARPRPAKESETKRRKGKRAKRARPPATPADGGAAPDRRDADGVREHG